MKPKFVPKAKIVKPARTKSNLDQERSLKDTLVPDFSDNPAAAAELFRSWRKNKKPINPAKALKPGNILYIKYRASTVKEYDANPVILVLRVSKRYVLAFNINWMSRKDRKTMINQFIKFKAHNMNRISMILLFKKLRAMRFPRSAYRVYFKSVIKEQRIYKLEIGDFYEAATKKLINKIKIR